MPLKLFDNETKSIRPLLTHGDNVVDVAFPHPFTVHDSTRCKLVVQVLDRVIRLGQSAPNIFYSKEVANHRRGADLHRLSNRYHPEVIAWTLLSSHYREPVKWSDDALEASKKTLNRYYSLLRGEIGTFMDADGVLSYIIMQPFLERLRNDIDIPKAIDEINIIADRLSNPENFDSAYDREALMKCGQILGVFRMPVETWE